MVQQLHREQKVPKRQCAALPCVVAPNGLRVMLITSRQTGRWVLPKGWAKRQLSGPELAALEAFEEAGLVGTIAEQAIGAYRYLKRLADGSCVPCDVDVFPMQVVELLDDWPEREQRQRRWFSLEEAAELVHEADLTMLLLNFGGMDVARAD